uniref:Uncharacterized protein n=1 Tax=Rangifer tarandus platyrhynchus TaxID=3082113 RepID=A0ACB0ESN6_RANTA|nr:unnamed protein product [Rangifer tarandus platyrhynchus]
MNHGRNPQPHSSAVAEGPAGDRSAGRGLGPHSHSHHGRLAKVPRWMPRWEGEGGPLSFHQRSRPPSTEAREHKLLWTRGRPAYTEVTRQTFVLSQKLFLTGISSFSSNFARMLNILIELQSSLNYESRTLEGDPSKEMVGVREGHGHGPKTKKHCCHPAHTEPPGQGERESAPTRNPTFLQPIARSELNVSQR